MPDIREVLAALDENDRRLYSQTRTRMRGAYLQALTEVVGIHAHDESDDALLDLIDIKVAILFDRAGRFAVAENVDTAEADRIEADIKDAVNGMNITKVDPSMVKSPATMLMQNGAADKVVANGWGH